MLTIFFIFLYLIWHHIVLKAQSPFKYNHFDQKKNQ